MWPLPLLDARSLHSSPIPSLYSSPIPSLPSQPWRKNKFTKVGFVVKELPVCTPGIYGAARRQGGLRWGVWWQEMLWPLAAAVTAAAAVAWL